MESVSKEKNSKVFRFQDLEHCFDRTGNRSQLINSDQTLSKFVSTPVALEVFYVCWSDISRLWFQE